jgi:hypothetical protein
MTTNIRLYDECVEYLNEEDDIELVKEKLKAMTPETVDAIIHGK